MDVYNLEYGIQLDPGTVWYSPDLWTHQIFAIWDAFGNTLNGTVLWEYGYNRLDSVTPWIGWSAFASGSTVGAAWGWSGNLQELVPTLMTNISLSILTQQLDVPGNATTSLQDTVCRSTDLHYTYNRVRLLGTYGAGILIAVGCLIAGFVALGANGRGEELGFTRILAAYPLLQEGDPLLTLDSVVKSNIDGRFIS